MTNETLEELQSELVDIEGLLKDVTTTYANAISCETSEDFLANLKELKSCFKSCLTDIDKLLRWNDLKA